MAHFANIDDNNNVLNVIVVDDKNCLDENGFESEAVGARFCEQIFGGKWIQTSYNNSIRGQFAGIGGVYLPSIDEFRGPLPIYLFWDEQGNLQENRAINPRTELPYTEGELEARRLREAIGKAEWLLTIGPIAGEVVEQWK